MLQPSIIEQELQRAIGKPCTLCGSLSDYGGVFIPSDAQSWGAMPNKSRFIVYPICGTCLAEKDCSERVEAVLAIEFGLVSIN